MLLSDEPDQLRNWETRIREFLRLRLRLEGPCRIWHVDALALEALRAVWASYEGHYSHADARGIQDRLWLSRPVSQRVLSRTSSGTQGALAAAHEPSGRVTRRFPRSSLARRYTSQIARLRVGIGDAVLVVQVGRYAELPGVRDARRSGFPVPRGARRRFRPGAQWCALGVLVRRLLDRGLTVALAVQRPELWPGTIQPRELRFLIENQPAPGHRGTCAGTKTAGECRA